MQATLSPPPRSKKRIGVNLVEKMSEISTKSYR